MRRPRQARLSEPKEPPSIPASPRAWEKGRRNTPTEVPGNLEEAWDARTRQTGAGKSRSPRRSLRTIPSTPVRAGGAGRPGLLEKRREGVQDRSIPFGIPSADVTHKYTRMHVHTHTHTLGHSYIN